MGIKAYQPTVDLMSVCWKIEMDGHLVTTIELMHGQNAKPLDIADFLDLIT